MRICLKEGGRQILPDISVWIQVVSSIFFNLALIELVVNDVEQLRAPANLLRQHDVKLDLAYDLKLNSIN